MTVPARPRLIGRPGCVRFSALDLALLVAAEHQGVLGRIQVQPHDIDQLVLEARIARDLEASAQVRLQAVALPDAAHGRSARAQVLGQRAGAPVRGVGRLLMQGDVHDARLHLGRDRRGASRTWRVLAKGIDAAVREALPPQRHLAAIEADLDGDVLVLQAPGGQQNDLRPLLKPSLHSTALGQRTKLPLRVLIQFNRLGNPHDSSLLGHWSELALEFRIPEPRPYATRFSWAASQARSNCIGLM